MIDDLSRAAYDVSMTAAWSDAELIERVRGQDEAACAELVRRHGGRMLTVIRRFLPQDADANDALQDAFLSAFRKIDQFDGKAQLGTWLHSIAVNAALQKLRRAKSRPESSLEELLPKFISDGHHAIEIPDWSPTAAAMAERDETRQQVRAAINRLPESYRTVLLARDIEGMDTEQTAQALGVSVPVVKTRLHRARLALRTLLEPIFAGDAT
jgi:RNA polymerase sigma-70 factor (ECF subfamily)